MFTKAECNKTPAWYFSRGSIVESHFNLIKFKLLLKIIGYPVINTYITTAANEEQYKQHNKVSGGKLNTIIQNNKIAFFCKPVIVAIFL